MLLAYVGCRTTKERNARGEGITTFEIKDGKWEEINLTKTLENPSYQVLHPNKKFLYSVHGDITKISSYEINGSDLEFKESFDIGGKNPVFIDIDKGEKHLIVAALQGGVLYSIEFQNEKIIEIKDKLEFKTETGLSFAHQCYFDKTKNYIFIPCQGRDRGDSGLYVVKINDGNFEITDYFKARKHSEPRHLVISSDNKHLYLINEWGNYVTFFEFDEENGRLNPRENISTLPNDYTGHSQASAIVLSPDEKVLIGSNRIFNHLVLYDVHADGTLSERDYVKTFGETPRFITFYKNNLYVLNEDSDTIIEYEYKDKSLIKKQTIESPSPVCLNFLEV
ncbi:lactonase family protein [Peptoniphilus sp. MSJ-1]|uniref:Lactonase family protein n=1 Tax=Peptoniphilus ovalis TaxID=2841503 RepID=A0ABS6FE94_9FIRM|nr:beta-propeller fold lactonase family protein [Peptoniphilus ovalis]MBU5668276.1 lactonase family protein [Peptoniphilus ovalis]